MGLTIDQVQHAILYLIAFILSISVHEFGHAWAATKLGDSTPRLQGRLSLLPTRHIDPIGTLLVPLIAMFGAAGFPLLAWGKPVQTNPLSYTRRLTRSTGRMLVAIAGPAMNLVMALVVSVAIVVLARAGVIDGLIVSGLISYLVLINLSLLFFNLLPIPPLDGGSVLAWALPRSMSGVVDFLTRWGFLILLGLMMIPRAMETIMFPAEVVKVLWVNALVGAAGL